MFFDENDYDAFWNPTAKYLNQREEIKGKLLDINVEMEKILKKEEYRKYNLKCLKNKTSSLVPIPHNNWKVDWIGISFYGKEKKIDTLIDNKKKDYLKSVKCNKFELNIVKTGLEMGLYISLDNNPDNWYVQKQLKNEDENFIKKLKTAIEQLQGYGYELNVGYFDTEDKNKKVVTFKIDNYKKEDVGNKFVEFYFKECQDKEFSYILYNYYRKDKRISEINDITNELLNHIERLYDLYKILSAPVQNEEHY